MAIQDYIVDVLAQAEDRFTLRLQEAAGDRQYADVATLASVSAQLHELIQSVNDNEPASEPRTTGRVPASSGSTAQKLKSRQGADKARYEEARAYPRFARSGDRLVKIAWSKKDGAEYEHRAPRVAVLAVLSSLRELGSREFSMEELARVRDKYGNEIPSYQVYLVMAWLRACGAVRKIGRGGYASIPENLTGAAMKEHWSALDGAPTSEGTSFND